MNKRPVRLFHDTESMNRKEMDDMDSLQQLGALKLRNCYNTVR